MSSNISNSIHNLVNAIDRSSTWTGKILLESSHWHVAKDKLFPCATGISNVSPKHNIDILQCISKDTFNDPKVDSILLHDLHYPPTAAFCLEGFCGTNDKVLENVKKFLYEKAIRHGHHLHFKKQTSKTYSHLIRCSCAFTRVRAQCKVSKNFTDGKLQAEGTIHQKEHQRTSTKGKSSSSYNTLASSKPIQSSRLSNGRFQEQINRTKSKRAISKDCTCNFAFSIFCDKTDNKWYIKKHKGASLCHQNHLPVDPDDLTYASDNLSDEIENQIKILVNQSLPTREIVERIKIQYGINISPNTVSKLKHEELNDLFPTLKSIPYGNDADRIITMLKSMENVSYVYVSHTKDSGLMTYVKPSFNREELTPIEREDLRRKWMLEVKATRDSLTISEDQTLLLALCWATDEQVRRGRLFPEYFAADMTFNINCRKRNLFNVTGIDGHMKIFTILRCFMPSKQTVAYLWVVSQALPYILGKHATKRIRCIATDAEDTLQDAINISLQDKRKFGPGVKHRLDCYHLFIQKWEDHITKTIGLYKDQETRNALKQIKYWIMSWFTSMESKAQFVESQKQYKRFFDELRGMETIKTNHVKEIEGIVTSIVKNIDKVGYWNFQYTTTFGFLGSTISESDNSSLKTGPHKANAKHSLEKSCHFLNKKTNERAQRLNVEMAKDMNRHSLYSRSNASSFLTDYMDGLSIKYFDNQTQLTIFYIGDNQWLVIRASFFDTYDKNHDLSDNRDGLNDVFDDAGTTFVSKHTKFENIRVVTLDKDGFLNCSCGNPVQYLCPCIHILAILGDTENIRAEIFHIRWWKHLNYFLDKKSSFLDETIPELQKKLEAAFQDTNSLCFDSCGKYKGVNISYLPNFTSNFSVDETSWKYKMVLAAQKCIRCEGYLERGSSKFKKYLETNATLHPKESSTSMFEEEDDDDLNIDGVVDGMGQNSQTDGSLSAFASQDYASNKLEVPISNEISRNEIQAALEDVIENCENCEDFDYVIMELRKMSLHLNQKYSVNSNVNCGTNVFLGEASGSKRKLENKRRKRTSELTYDDLEAHRRNSRRNGLDY